MTVQTNTVEATPAVAPWLFTEHTYASVNNITIETAIDEITRYTDAEGIAAAKRIQESFADSIRPGEKLSYIALAALMFARSVMIDLTDSVAEIDAETEATEARLFRNRQKLKAV